MPSRIGKFEILGTLGRGAMGEVYLGKDPSIGREVAIKTIRPSLIGADLGGDMRERFAREAHSAGLLNHPNVVTVFEFGEDEDLLYLVMERVKGEDLQDLLGKGELGAAQVLELTAQVCDGLHHAHKHGIVHRDIKPSNVMVERDEEGAHRAKLMDFGVAKSGVSGMTQTGQVVGTLAYMAPEYLRTGQASPQTDIFSMGVMLHEALAGEKPFSGETTGAVLYNIIHDPPKPLDPAKLAGVSPAVAGLVGRALCKDPEGRYVNAAEFARLLRAAKDPRWNDGEDATTALPRLGSTGARASAATDPVGRPTVPAAGGSKKLLVAVAAILVLGAGGYGLKRLLKPAPAAPPPVQVPTSGSMHINDAVLDSAAKIADKDPDAALLIVKDVIDATPKEVPVDPDAYAVKLVCLYHKNQIEAFGEALAESKFRGVTAKGMLENTAYKAMLDRDKNRKKLPADLRERLLKGQDD